MKQDDRLSGMLCPSCGGEMTPGWISSFKKLRWIDGETNEAPTRKGGVVLPDGPWLDPRLVCYLPALRCVNCELCIVDYAEEEQAES